MKYIIEIKPEYEDKFRGVMILGAENSNLYVDSQTADELEELNSDYINEHFGELQQDAYDRGYKDGRNVTETQAHDDAYQKGLEDGRTINDKGCEGCLYNDGTKEHSQCDICCNAYLNRWTAKQTDDEIKVGDEVADKDGDKTIVTNIHGDLFDGLCSDGSTMTDLFLDDNHKTGRHFDIASILEDMRT